MRAPAWLAAVLVALMPCRGRADDLDEAGPLCDDSRPIMTGELADCDGLLVGPQLMGSLLEARERVRLCGIDLRLERELLRVERERCDGRLALVNEALERANAKLRQPPRWQWETAVVGLALGLVLGAGVTAYVATR